MKKLIIIFITLFSFVSLAFSQDNNYVPGEIIVWLKSNSDAHSLSSDFRSINLRPKEAVVDWMNIWLYEYDYALTDANLVLNEIRKNRSVHIAQFNHYVSQRSIFPNDTRFSEQWALHNTGQTGGLPDADIDAPEAWNIVTGGLTTTGDSIVIAVIDGGFYLNHLDLKFWRNYFEVPANGIDDDNNGYIDDVNGWNAYNNTGNITPSGTHGTHVSGTAGALGNNNLGVSGVNWNAKIMAIQGASGTEAIVIRAYGYALKLRRVYDQTNGVQGAFVVSTNSSFGVDYGQPSNYPLWCAFYDSLGTRGILNACATANININIDIYGDIPTACPSPFMVSVTNTTHQDLKNSGAAWGPTTIDLGAPGTSILSTTSANNYGLSTGTSMATPHVAGAIALMFAAAPPSLIQAYKNDPWTVGLIFKDKLLQGVDTLPALQNITVSHGRLNVYKSILLIQTLTANGNITAAVPKFYKLYINYPNPFNPSTLIRYDIPKGGLVTLKVYDALGREVSTLVNKELKPGSYETFWNASNFTTGVYFYKLEASGFSQTNKMVLIK
ncbi:MAG: S8 family serine peptidase [Ignavibacteria bacterium]